MKRRRSRTLVRVLGVAGLIVVAVACGPTFPSGAKITPSPIGGLIKITWNPAGSGVTKYRIDVNNAQVGTVTAPTANCVLTGLAASTTYTLKVTPLNNGNEAGGALSLSYKTPATGGAGTTKACVSSTDSDGDRLPNAVETNNGNFESSARTGTNPSSADTDGDAIKDGDETVGTTGGLNLRGMGAKPTHKNIFFEHDWMNDSQECGSHSHRPSAAVISRLNAAYAGGAISNPDGVNGITVINDYGQGGLFTGGNQVADSDGNVVGTVEDSEFIARKNANFNSNRNGYFHYIIHMHRYAGGSTNSSGVAELPGDDLIVSLQCGFGNTSSVSNTIMHEAGHNLNLKHGGQDHLPNYKLNFNSVMNYRFQFPGVDTNCDAVGDGKLDYGRGVNPDFNEADFTDAKGVCGAGHPIDWNGDGIDSLHYFADFTQDGQYTVLKDWNDWSHISFTGLSNADGRSTTDPIVVLEQDTPENIRNGG